MGNKRLLLLERDARNSNMKNEAAEDAVHTENRMAKWNGRRQTSIMVLASKTIIDLLKPKCPKAVIGN